MTKRIQDPDLKYTILRELTRHHFMKVFPRYEVQGTENIPTQGSLIFASNHCGALLDPLAISFATPQQKVFLMRADFFKNKHFAKFLTICKTMPVFRIRDGISSVRDKNTEIINKAVDVACSTVPLSLFPEGTHRPKHSLLPLSKGIFHIALEAHRQHPEQPVFIQPIGVEYEDYFRLRKSVLINFGEPINVSEYIKNHSEETDPFIITGLRKILAERLANLIAFIPDDDDYDGICELARKESVNIKGKPSEKQRHFKKAIESILKMKTENPEKAKHLIDNAKKCHEERLKKGISIHSIASPPTTFSILWKSLVALCGLPFFILALILNLPIWLVAKIMRHRVKDKAFGNTLEFAVEYVLHPVLTTAVITLSFCFLPWQMALIISILFYPSYNFVLDYSEFFRIFWSDCKALKYDFRPYFKY